MLSREVIFQISLQLLFLILIIPNSVCESLPNESTPDPNTELVSSNRIFIHYNLYSNPHFFQKILFSSISFASSSQYDSSPGEDCSSISSKLPYSESSILLSLNSDPNSLIKWFIVYQISIT